MGAPSRCGGDWLPAPPQAQVSPHPCGSPSSRDLLAAALDMGFGWSQCREVGNSHGGWSEVPIPPTALLGALRGVSLGVVSREGRKVL